MPKKIALVVGHRKHRPGAYGNAGISEFEYNSNLAKDIAETLKQEDLELKIFYRKDIKAGYGELMKDLHKRIDAWGANYSISMHFNSSGTPLANGHEVLFCSQRGKRAAKVFDFYLDKHLSNRDRNIKKRSKKDRGGGFLCRGKSVCIIVEPFFAAHQRSFIPGTDGYIALKNAYVEAIKTLGELGKVRYV